MRYQFEKAGNYLQKLGYTWVEIEPGSEGFTAKEANVPAAPFTVMFTDPYYDGDGRYATFTETPNYSYIVNLFTFNTLAEFLSCWEREINEKPNGMWYWVMFKPEGADVADVLTSGACAPEDIEIFADYFGFDPENTTVFA